MNANQQHQTLPPPHPEPPHPEPPLPLPSPLPSPRRLPVLPPRLQAIAACVPEGTRIVDVGTDHGLLPAWLVASGQCPGGIASDLRPGPAAAASQTIRRYGLSGQIRVTVTAGLDGHVLLPDDTLVIAGLGGLEMISILSPAAPPCACILLQPQKSIPELRQWLGGHGYAIDAEILVLDRDRLYTVLQVHQDGQVRIYDRLTAVVGPCLLHDRPRLFAEHLRRLHRALAKTSRGEPAWLPVLAAIETLIAEIKEEATD